ncbi:RusA family crossover junction endodeoxyribonuclease [Polynucleobacter sp.]|uniref:RusA family crossover junction endodeoxyribonuclease n=1 Tax=Polynucleobacter sp. TaxID=2029855 RepID=UPI003F69D1AD
MGQDFACSLKFGGEIVGANQRYAFRGSKNLSAEYVTFKHMVGWSFKSQNPGFLPLEGKLRINLFFNSGHDWDNVCKGIFDALQGIAYTNDRQIKDAHIIASNEIEPGFWLYISQIGEL